MSLLLSMVDGFDFIDTIFINPASVIVITGTVNLTSANSWPCRAFPNGSGTIVTHAVPWFPPGWEQYDVELLWANASTGTGDVDWRVDHDTKGPGDTIANPSSGSTTRITASAQNVLRQDKVRTGLTPHDDGDATILRFVRTGNTDTLANAANVFGFLLVKTDP